MKIRQFIVVVVSLMMVLGYTVCTFASENAYTVRVDLDDSRFAGSRVELLTSDGAVIKAWNLKEKGELVADLAPGSYTLREIVEINGYEMPMNSNIMVGCGELKPFNPNPDFPDATNAEFDPQMFDDEYAPSALPDLPDYIYDDFQKWIDQL